MQKKEGKSRHFARWRYLTSFVTPSTGYSVLKTRGIYMVLRTVKRKSVTASPGLEDFVDILRIS